MEGKTTVNTFQNVKIEDCCSEHEDDAPEFNKEYLRVKRNTSPEVLNCKTMHTRDCEGIINYICDLCCLNCTCFCALKTHLQGHLKEDTYRCNICGDGFLLVSKLKIHQKKCMEEINPNWDVCVSRSPMRNTFSDIFDCKQSHTSDLVAKKIYICDLCCLNFTCISALKIHIHGHLRENSCDFCGKNLASINKLKIHQVKCTGERYFRGSTVDNYRKTQKNIYSGQKLYECNICGLGFTQITRLKDHTKIHTGEKPYVCDFCGKGFSKNSDLTIHRRRHTGEKPYVCDICGVGFITGGNLRQHRKTHTGEKPCICDICGKGFFQNSNLREHKVTHTGEKPFQCDICGRGFVRSSDLNAHKRRHTGEKPYICDVCGVGFTTVGNMFQHRRTHRVEKPIKCDVCGKGFNRNSNLTEHKRMHTGEKPYMCDICEKRFAYSSKLARHKRIHQKQETLLIR